MLVLDKRMVKNRVEWGVKYWYNGWIQVKMTVLGWMWKSWEINFLTLMFGHTTILEVKNVFKRRQFLCTNSLHSNKVKGTVPIDIHFRISFLFQLVYIE